MKNNYWEEQDMSKELLEFHEQELEKMNIPNWIKDLTCPFCHKHVPLSAIRNIQLCLNTRNMGDIAIEIMCGDCRMMDTVYFNEGIANMNNFCEYLTTIDLPKSTPVIEEAMYKSGLNNTVSKYIISNWKTP